MRRPIFALLLSMTAMSCSQTQSELTRFHEDGRAKPVVAIASFIDTTSVDLPWSLSEELTSLLSKKISENGQLFVSIKDDFSSTDTPFGKDLSWIKKEMPDDQFAVFLELAEHEIVPEKEQSKLTSGTAFESAMNLKTAIKLRVIDLRGSSPRIVLQERVQGSYYIPKNAVPVNYQLVTWGSDEYRRTPMGLAHTQLVQEISLRINDYIQLAKSR